MPTPIKHICYADDDADDHLIFSIVLNEEFPSIKYELFYYCEDLLKYLNSPENPLPDVIFLDYNMIGNTGNQCLREIKKTPGLMHLPVIIYSTSKYDVIQNQCYRDGAYKYLVKAPEMGDVKKNLKSIISEIESSS